MEFDKSKVYTSLNADKLKIGSKVICSDNMHRLKDRVELEENVTTLQEVRPDDFICRFLTKDNVEYILAYLISEPEEKKLKVSDLKLGDIVRHKSGKLEYLVTGIDHSENEVFFCNAWSDDEILGKYWEKVEK